MKSITLPLFTLLLISLRPLAPAAVITVTTTDNDSGPGDGQTSLLEAVQMAGDGDTIEFHIPATAAGCTGTPAVCTIQPRRALPALRASSTVIDGGSQLPWWSRRGTGDF